MTLLGYPSAGHCLLPRSWALILLLDVSLTLLSCPGACCPAGSRCSGDGHSRAGGRSHCRRNAAGGGGGTRGEGA